MRYLHLATTDPVPQWSGDRPFKAIVLVTQDVPDAHRLAICRKLVNAGCRYLMIHGEHCRAWDEFAHQVTESQENASTRIPDEQIVMTTWHERESLADVLWFAKHTAMHPCFTLDDLWVLDLSPTERERQLHETWDAISA